MIISTSASGNTAYRPLLLDVNSSSGTSAYLPVMLAVVMDVIEPYLIGFGPGLGGMLSAFLNNCLRSLAAR